jgi:hypothetical protein
MRLVAGVVVAIAQRLEQRRVHARDREVVAGRLIREVERGHRVVAHVLREVEREHAERHEDPEDEHQHHAALASPVRPARH